MDLPVFVAFALGVEALALVAADAVVHHLLVRRHASPTPAEWRARSSSLASDLHEFLDGRERPVDREAVARTVLPLVGRFDRLVRESPSEVDATLAARVHGLGEDCRRLAVEFPHRGSDHGRPYDDRVAAVATRARLVARDVETCPTDAVTA